MENINNNVTVAQIYSIIKHWYLLEKKNVESGTEIEQRWLDTLVNFDFSGLDDTEKDNSSILILEELFTASEQCFIPNRMKLMASQIIERFGSEFIDLFNSRLEYSLLNVWGVEKK